MRRRLMRSRSKMGNICQAVPRGAARRGARRWRTRQRQQEAFPRARRKDLRAAKVAPQRSLWTGGATLALAARWRSPRPLEPRGHPAAAVPRRTAAAAAAWLRAWHALLVTSYEVG